jgi:murein DD-endopeptidase MepM/ murein hydrolase activator NlpD
MEILMQKLYNSIAIFIMMIGGVYANVSFHIQPVQGALLLGTTTPNVAVKFDGVTQQSDDKGHFVIGIGRDAPSKMTILIDDTIHKFTVKQRTFTEQRISGLPKKKVTPPKSFLERIKRESNMIKQARKIISIHTFFKRTWHHPTTGIITGVYGSRRVLNGIPKFPHYGIDYATKTGTPIVAPQMGVVRLVQTDNYYSGTTLIIDHGRGVNTAYLHLSKAFVKVGQIVGRGQKIGLVGTTGRSTGPHLDWRINWRHVRLDPALLTGIDLGINPSGKTIK